MKKTITMLMAGESPEFGAFGEGDELTVDAETAQLLNDRGIAKIKTEED